LVGDELKGRKSIVLQIGEIICGLIVVRIHFRTTGDIGCNLSKEES